MNRLLVATALLAFGAMAYAGGLTKPPQQVGPGPTSVAPQLTSAQFTQSQYVPGEHFSIKFNGINLVNKTGPVPNTICQVKVDWPTGFVPNGITPHAFWAAFNGAWQVVSFDYLKAPDPGTYQLTFHAMNVPVLGTSQTDNPCVGTATATMVVVKGLQPAPIPSAM